MGIIKILTNFLPFNNVRVTKIYILLSEVIKSILQFIICDRTSHSILQVLFSCTYMMLIILLPLHPFYYNNKLLKMSAFIHLFLIIEIRHPHLAVSYLQHTNSGYQFPENRT